MNGILRKGDVMSFLSAYLWEKGSEESHMRISLLLQQAEVDKQNVLFACVCESENAGEAGITESGYFSEGLTEWFHREGISLLGRKEGNRGVSESLFREIDRLEGENADYLKRKGCVADLQYWGILVCEQRGWIFSRGECKGYLLNKRFQKKQIQEIISRKERGELFWQEARIHKNLGILICTKDFLGKMEEKELCEVLVPDTDISEGRMQKRLEEIWIEQKYRGNLHSAGVIYFRT